MINIPKNKNVGEKLWKEKNCRTKFIDRTKQKRKRKKGAVAWRYRESG
jgi:hypothetical protein